MTRVFIRTCDARLPALRVMLHLINRHWYPNPEVVVGGYARPDWPLPPNVIFHSLGENRDYPVGRWSNATAKLLHEVPDEVFVLLLEDFWPTRDVDGRAIDILADYARQFTYVARIDLTGDRLYAGGADLNYGHVAHLDLIKSMPGSPYHLSLMGGIWRREHLLRHLTPNWSPWDCELQGTTQLSHDQQVIVLGTRQWPLRHTLAFRAQEPGRVLTDELDLADLAELRRLGYLAPWEVE